MARANIREEILAATNRVLARDGLFRTTVEAVAQEAGVSKGGLFYYFRNKKELLLAMLEKYAEEFYRKREETLAELPPAPTRLLKATVTVMLKNLLEVRQDIPNLATLLDDPDLRAWVGAFKRRLFEESGGDIQDKAGVALIVYIVDGLWADTRFEPRVFDMTYKLEAAGRLEGMIDALR